MDASQLDTRSFFGTIFLIGGFFFSLYYFTLLDDLIRRLPSHTHTVLDWIRGVFFLNNEFFNSQMESNLFERKKTEFFACTDITPFICTVHIVRNNWTFLIFHGWLGLEMIGMLKMPAISIMHRTMHGQPLGGWR